MYIYRHIREDLNVPFYVGYGTDNKGLYSRSKTKSKRSNYWNSITLKTSYRIDIILDDIEDLEELKQKEIEFIKLYGRSDLGEGTLVNLTDGGDGQLRYKQTQEHISKKYTFEKGYKPWNTGLKGKYSSLINRGKSYSSKTIEKMRISHKSYELEHYDHQNNLINTFPSLMEAHRVTGIAKASLGSYIRNKSLNRDGYRFIIKGEPLHPHKERTYPKHTHESKFARKLAVKHKIPIVKKDKNGGILDIYLTKADCIFYNKIGAVTLNKYLNNSKINKEGYKYLNLNV